MKEKPEALPKTVWLAFLCFGACVLVAGCQASKDALRSLGDAERRSMQNSYRDQSVPTGDAMAKSSWLVEQIVPIDSRGLGSAAVRGSHVTDLRPVASGPGIVVCQPHSEGASLSVKDYGDACGDWLHLIVAGQPEFGKTPAIQSVVRASQELGGQNMELTLEQARRLYRMVGVNYVAVGTIQGSADHCSLGYQVYALPSAKPIGKPISANGSEMAVLAQLPTMARAMIADLGDATPNLPASVGISNPDDFAFLGKVGRTGDISSLPSKDQARMASLAKSAPLAGILYTNAIALKNETQMTGAVKTLFSQLPDNPIVYAHIGWIDASDLLPYRQTIEAKYHKYPKNSLFASATVYLSRMDYEPQTERDAAEQAARCAWQNPDAWLTLAYTISNDAEAVRKARYTSLLSPSESSYISSLYPQWVSATQYATELDPNHGKAWERLAEAASFYGDGTLASQALQNALKLDPNHAEVYSWGLQMYQDKWFGDASELAKIANMAAADKYATDDQTLGVYDDLMGANCIDQATTLLQKYKAVLRKRIAANPKDAYAHWSLAACYYHQQLFPQAIEEYNIAAKLLPGVSGVRYNLGEAYFVTNQIDAAVQAYQATLALDPDHKTAHYDLAYAYSYQRKAALAVEQFNQALRINPFYGEAYYGLGTIYQGENKPSEAVSFYRKSIKYTPYISDAYVELANLLDSERQNDSSLQVAYAGLLVYPENTSLVTTIEDDCLQLHDYDRVISICNKALEVNADEAYAHENLAEAYLGKGDKAQAVAEWHKVEGYNNANLNPVAKSFLAKYE